MEYSTIPGTSRHHWGTDIDIIDANQPYKGDPLESDKFHGDGPFCALKEWMDLHANTFGFYLVYTDNDKRTGFYYEPGIIRICHFQRACLMRLKTSSF